MIDVEFVEIVLAVTSARTGERRTYVLRRVRCANDDWVDAIHRELRAVHVDEVGTALDGYEV